MAPLPTPPKRIWIIDHARSRSHVFFKLFEQNPQLQQIYHPYVECGTFGPERNSLKFRNNDTLRKQTTDGWKEAGILVDTTFADANAQLKRAVEEAENGGKIVFGNEHAFHVLNSELKMDCIRGPRANDDVKDLVKMGNPTNFENWLWESMTPIFVLRHPAYSLRSYHRVIVASGLHVTPADESFENATTLRWSRMLFDVLRAQGREVIVVDGDDSIWRFEEMADAICQKLKIDRDGVKDTWERFTKEKLEEKFPGNSVLQSYFTDLVDSTGVKRGGGGMREEVDLDVEEKKWVEEFGEDTASLLRRHVEKSLPHWEYLMQYKV